MTLGTSPLNVALSFAGLLVGALVGGLLSRWSAPATIGFAFFGGILGSLLSELVADLPSVVWHRLRWGSLGGVLVGLAFALAFNLLTPDLEAGQRWAGAGIALLVGAIAGAIAWAGFQRLREVWPSFVENIRFLFRGGKK